MKRVVSSVFGLLVGLGAIGVAVPAQAEIYNSETFDHGFTGWESDLVEIYNNQNIKIFISSGFVWMQAFDGTLLVAGRVSSSTPEGTISQLMQFNCTDRRYRDRGGIIYNAANGDSGTINNPIEPEWQSWSNNLMFEIAGQEFCSSARQELTVR